MILEFSSSTLKRRAAIFGARLLNCFMAASRILNEKMYKESLEIMKNIPTKNLSVSHVFTLVRVHNASRK